MENMSFQPVGENDFPTLTRWLAEPHVRRFYQKTPVTLAEVAAEYGPPFEARSRRFATWRSTPARPSPICSVTATPIIPSGPR